jgi:hypothetical protein
MMESMMRDEFGCYRVIVDRSGVFKSVISGDCSLAVSHVNATKIWEFMSAVHH